MSALIDQVKFAGSSLRLAVYDMQRALAEAQSVVDAAVQPRSTTTGRQLLRHLGD